jgi:hypothetical protein
VVKSFHTMARTAVQKGVWGRDMGRKGGREEERKRGREGEREG